MSEIDVREWANSLLEKQAWVLHTPTLSVGAVRRFYDGEETKWRSTIDGNEVPSPVLELETGHGFIANPEVFVEMSAAELRLYVAIQQGLSTLVAVVARNASTQGVRPHAGFALLIAAFRAQLAALERPEEEALG